MDGHVVATHRERPRWLPFLKACAVLGVTGYGGGLAILGQAGDLFARKRWLTEREWLHTATVAQLLPGGAATNALAYAGLRFFGAWGALAGVFVYVTPAAVMMIAFALGYEHMHEVPHLEALFNGFNAAVVGIVAAVTWRLGQAGLRRGWQAVLAALALALERLGHATVLEVIVFGILAGLAADPVQKQLRLRARRRTHRRSTDAPIDALTDTPDDDEPASPGSDAVDGEPTDGEGKPPEGGKGPLSAFALVPGAWHHKIQALIAWFGLSGVAVPVTLAVFFTFARVGAVAYGGGFTIVPLLEREAVEQHAWINHKEFADAIALGQVTPGPVIIAATFIGTRAGGVAGGVLATLGVFGVPALLVIGAGAWLDRWRRARPVKAALRGLVPAVVGMMTAAAIGLAGAGIHGEVGVVLAVVAFVSVTQFRLNPALVVLVSGGLRVALQVSGYV